MDIENWLFIIGYIFHFLFLIFYYLFLPDLRYGTSLRFVFLVLSSGASLCPLWFIVLFPVY
jgi:hypothetical protein